MLTKIKSFIKIAIFVRNWPGVLFGVLIKNGEVIARFRSGFALKVSKLNWYEFMQHVDFFRYFPSGKIDGDLVSIVFDGTPLKFNLKNSRPIDLGEVFSQKSYDFYLKKINLGGKTVVDVGAAIGDTPIFFALKGAGMVIAIEPLPNSFSVLKENIKLNGFKNIIPINIGVGSKPLTDISLDPMFPELFGVYPELKNQFIGGIPVVTLDSIVREYKVENGILKMDCEGWEYGIFRNIAREVLRNFEYIIMEYHYGFDELEAILKRADFEVEHTEPISLYVPERRGEFQNYKVGMLFAKRMGD